MFESGIRNSLADHSAFLKSSLFRLLASNPMGFIDIGARGGAHDIVDPIAKHTAVLGFEPDEAECQRLLNNSEVTSPWAKFALEPIALADTARNATLHLLSAATNHSLLPPNFELTRRYQMVKWQEIGSCELQTVALDSLIFGSLLNENYWGEFIKIDTQGTEYEILLGAKKTLETRTVAVVAEVSFCELYQGQKLFSEVEQFMRSVGFTFYGFMPIHTRSRKFLDKRTHITIERSLYTDAVFFKDPLAGNSWNYSLTDRQSKVLFIIALLLSYYDFALELAEETWMKESDELERSNIQSLVRDLSSFSASANIKALEALLEEVKSQPELANVRIGNFVDRRRRFCDYDDVLNISPLPKTL